MSSFSEQLQDLLNPQPKFADPEDDDEDEVTKAKVVDRFGDDDDEGAGISILRKGNTTLLSDTDQRYAGKPVSRKQLLMEEEGDDESMEEQAEDVEEEEDYGSDVEEDSSGEEEPKGSDIVSPPGVNFCQMTEGMEGLGMSEEEDDVSGLETEDSEEDQEKEEASDEELEDAPVQTFSKDKVEEEVEKGKAVKNQLALWDQLLEGRIKIQKALVTANQLPQPNTFPEVKRRGGPEVAGALKNAHKALKALQRSLLELHDELLCQNTDTRAVALGDMKDVDDDEIESDEDKGPKETGPPKRKLEMSEYPDFMTKRFAAFQPYQNTTLQKWHDKTRLTTGKSNKGFGAFDRNILTQVEHVLADKDRLLRRTQTRRSEYRVLGKKETSEASSQNAPPAGVEEGAEQQLKANLHLKDLDEDIFDDDDFYHQLLRELIERKTSTVDPNDQVAMGRQWLAIQKLRSKIKKKVDTKASKGRKVRFHVHSKLVNFMAPINHSSMSDEARNELYRGLFGRNVEARE